MHPEIHLALHHSRAVGLRAEADAHRLAAAARTPRRPRLLRARLGWTLVEVGLRLATAPRPPAAVS
ncbi:hypothetical protein [Streptomyces griseomycini]|uniref:Uncharacterized protein n=1 Tax=Streptomyces griseomycini TaxID=66895 RepID=A0A7W7LV21_9ACTN|nr:hypothetical protein [Streptomyces griseomycini]MBB4896714.1 hypothetical protein [Streptomyces griseomycini]GGP86217.1 hypothetical protein GCM10010266_05760 [Streptomyces griseomycini]GGR00469.1 hypothetical protein GCM10015536_01160 [Streptomyces griseomycini]